MNEKQLEKWLEDKPQEVASAIASRAALRVAPILTKDFVKNQKELNKLQVQSLRCYLISSLAAKRSSDDIESAALSAARSAASALSAARSAADSAARSAARSAAYSAAFSAADSAFSAADSAFSAAASAFSAAAFEIWPEVEWDMGFIDENGVESAASLVEQPLFNIRGNNWGTKYIEPIQKLSQIDGYAWWSNWLMQMHDGAFRNWDLAHKIALIDDTIWNEGAIAVAEKIKEFEEETDRDEDGDASSDDAYEKLADEQKSILQNIAKQLVRTPKASAFRAKTVAMQIWENLARFENCDLDEPSSSILEELSRIAQSYLEISENLDDYYQSKIDDKDAEILRLTKLLAKRDAKISKLKKKLKKQEPGFFRRIGENLTCGAVVSCVFLAIDPVLAQNSQAKDCQDVYELVEQMIIEAPDNVRQDIEYIPIPERRPFDTRSGSE